MLSEYCQTTGKKKTRVEDERDVKGERTIYKVIEIQINRNREAAAARNLRRMGSRNDFGVY